MSHILNQLLISKQMKRGITLLAILMVTYIKAGEPLVVIEEEKQPNNKIYLELGGITGVYSLNYERTIFRLSDKISFSGRAFGGLISVNPELGLDYWGGLGLNVNYELTPKHLFHIGANQWILNYKVYDFFEPEGQKSVTEYPTSFSLGYSLNFKSGWFLGASYTPLLLYNEPETDYVKFQSWGGVSFGKKF